jgi:hypothetical protein
MKIVTFTIKDMDGTRNESQKRKRKKERDKLSSPKTYYPL